MGARFYSAESENGDRIEDPSEDALFMMISDLNDTDNTCIVVQPDTEYPVWFASVAVLDEGGYEVVLRDAGRREHEVIMLTRIGEVARSLSLWLTIRSCPGRPTPPVFGL
ncbi:hypothetical protein [Streptomyces aureus]